MAIAMKVEHDPASPVASAVILTVIGLACALLALVVHQPIFGH
jgi:hypothetical protein